MAHSKIGDAERYLLWLEKVLNHTRDIEVPKERDALVEIDRDHDGYIIGWLIPHKRVRFCQGSELTCTEDGEVTASGQYCIPEYHFHFQPGVQNPDMEVFRLDLDRGEEAHFNSSEARRASGDHIKNEQTPFDFSNFNCRLALLMSMVYLRTKVYPLDDVEQQVYEPVLSQKKDG